jgi:membrane protease YdiL (CAAX protease family)
VSSSWKDGWIPEVLAAAVTLAYSLLLNAVIPEPLHILTNMLAAVGLIWLALHTGATVADVGLERDSMLDGARLGVRVALPIVGVVLVAIAVPFSRDVFVSEAAATASLGPALFDILVRIPFGTVIPEELIFRGALMGLMLRRHSPIRAATYSSLLFGVWHVLPTLSSLDAEAADVVSNSTLEQTGAILLTVFATGAIGFVFAWLRLRSRSVVAPIIAHLAFNVTATAGGRVARQVFDATGR